MMEKNGSIVIREFHADDAAACFRIRNEAFINLFYDEIGPAAVTMGVNAYLPERYIEMAMSSPFFVAAEDQGLAGFIASRRLEASTMEILFLYVKLDCLRVGIGSRLLRYFEEFVGREHPEIDRIVVDTVIPKYNLSFYEKMGYSQAGSSTCQYPAGSVQAIRLEKILK